MTVGRFQPWPKRGNAVTGEDHCRVLGGRITKRLNATKKLPALQLNRGGRHHDISWR